LIGDYQLTTLKDFEGRQSYRSTWAKSLWGKKRKKGGGEGKKTALFLSLRFTL